ncbi:terminase large subunit [Staphylococcus phage PG-2021_40]
MQNKMYIDALKSKEIRTYQIIDNDLQTYLRHWKNVVIRDQEDDKTGEYYQVITRRGDD